MSYVTRAEIQTEIPAMHLFEALDDDRDGIEDEGLFDSLVLVSDLEVDSYLSGVFSVPFTGVIPPTVRHASFLFLGELVYNRRPHVSSKNPFSVRAEDMRKRLELIGKGKLQMDYATAPIQISGAIINETPIIDGPLR